MKIECRAMIVMGREIFTYMESVDRIAIEYKRMQI